MNIPWVGSLEELVTSSYSLEYLPDALKWIDSAHYVQSPAYIAKTVTLVKHFNRGKSQCCCISIKQLLIIVQWNIVHTWSKPSYSFGVGVHVTVGKELMKNNSKTPDIWLVGESGLTYGLRSVPEHKIIFQWLFKEWLLIRAKLHYNLFAWAVRKRRSSSVSDFQSLTMIQKHATLCFCLYFQSCVKRNVWHFGKYT